MKEVLRGLSGPVAILGGTILGAIALAGLLLLSVWIAAAFSPWILVPLLPLSVEGARRIAVLAEFGLRGSLGSSPMRYAASPSDARASAAWACATGVVFLAAGAVAWEAWRGGERDPWDANLLLLVSPPLLVLCVAAMRRVLVALPPGGPPAGAAAGRSPGTPRAAFGAYAAGIAASACTTLLVFVVMLGNTSMTYDPARDVVAVAIPTCIAALASVTAGLGTATALLRWHGQGWRIEPARKGMRLAAFAYLVGAIAGLACLGLAVVGMSPWRIDRLYRHEFGVLIPAARAVLIVAGLAAPFLGVIVARRILAPGAPPRDPVTPAPPGSPAAPASLAPRGKSEAPGAPDLPGGLLPATG